MYIHIPYMDPGRHRARARGPAVYVYIYIYIYIYVENTSPFRLV